MLLNLHKKSWMEGLTLQDYSEHCKLNETIVKEMLELAKNYNKVNLFLKWPFRAQEGTTIPVDIWFQMFTHIL